MSIHKTRALTLVICAIMTLALTVFIAGCAPKDAQEEGTSQKKTNDIVSVGDLDHYDPEAEQQHSAGASMGFDEESNLQQEKTAGFSGGAVVSNIEPLNPGIDAYADREPIGIDATTGEPAEIPHGNSNGSNCLSCHSDGDHAVPQNHLDNNLTNEDCTGCHK